MYAGHMFEWLYESNHIFLEFWSMKNEKEPKITEEKRPFPDQKGGL